MALSLIFRETGIPDISEMEKNRDVWGLITLLSHRDFRIRNEAADAIGRLGSPAIAYLSRPAAMGKQEQRLGVMEALSRIKDPTCIPWMKKILASDPCDEMRWMAAITLGEVGSSSVIGDLEGALKDRNKYVRFGAAKALEKLGWRPVNPGDEVRFRVALQEWGAIPGMTAIPAGVLEEYLDDSDPRVRESIVFLLGYLKNNVDEKTCTKILQDPDPRVRWKASLALPSCNVSSLGLPAATFRRRREVKSVHVASFLNFFFLGLGYNYLGKWWGFLVFQITINTIMILTLLYGTLLPYLLSFSVSSIAVIHTRRMMKEMPDI